MPTCLLWKSYWWLYVFWIHLFVVSWTCWNTFFGEISIQKVENGRKTSFGVSAYINKVKNKYEKKTCIGKQKSLVETSEKDKKKAGRENVSCGIKIKNKTFLGKRSSQSPRRQLTIVTVDWGSISVAADVTFHFTNDPRFWLSRTARNQYE